MKTKARTDRTATGSIRRLLEPAPRVAYVLASLGAAHDLLDLLDVPPHERRRPWGFNVRDAEESDGAGAGGMSSQIPPGLADMPPEASWLLSEALADEQRRRCAKHRVRDCKQSRLCIAEREVQPRVIDGVAVPFDY